MGEFNVLNPAASVLHASIRSNEMIEDTLSNENQQRSVISIANFVKTTKYIKITDNLITTHKEKYDAVLFLCKNFDLLSDSLVKFMNSDDETTKKMGTILALSWCFNFRWGVVDVETTNPMLT